MQARVPFTVGYPATTIRTDKTQYQVNESISVTYANMPGYAKDYVTVVPATASDGAYAQYVFTNGQKNGTMTFTGMTAAGQYEARVHYDNEDSTVRARYAFAVGSACTFTISPTSANLPAAGGSGSVTVTASGSTCAWKASPSASWVAVMSGASGTGNGTVSYTVAANTAASSRTATISVEGQTLTVTQAGAASPGVTLVRAVTLAAMPASCSDLGPAVTSFAATDAVVVLVLTVSGQSTGDVGSVDYITPSGQVYAAASGPWAAITADQASSATFCLRNQMLKIAGASAAAMPGGWTAKISWNGVVLTTLNFTITPAPFPAPGPISPAQGATGAATATTFNWGSVAGAAKYWLTVAKSAAALPTDPNATACAACVISQKLVSTTFTVATPLEANVTYYWEVQAFDDSVAPIRQGQYSAPWSFTTQAAGGTNLLVNGSFEQPGGAMVNLLPAPGFMAGWTVTRSQVVYAGNYFTCSDGKVCIDLAGATDTGGGIAQTVTTVPGTAYNLTFDLSGNPDGGAPVKRLRVAIGGQATDFTFDTTGKSLKSMGWVAKTLPFTAAGASTAIEFYSLDPGYWGPVIDNTKVVAGGGGTPGCTTATISPSSANALAAGGTGAVQVTAATGCTWKASTNAGWLTIGSGASGSGNGTVNYAVAANTSATSRTGTLTIAGQTFTVTQAGAAATGVPTISSISNADDGLGWFTPGSRLSIKGSQFGATGNDATWPSSVGGATVEISDAVHMVNAPLSGITPDTITALVPFDLTGAQVQVRVRTSKGASDAYALPLAARSPHILTDNQVDGPGGAQATHLDGSGVSSGSPAQSGEVIDLHVLGLGTTLPLAEAGTAGGDGSPDTPFNSVSSVTATIGGLPAEVLSAVLEGVNGYRVRVGVPEPLVPGTYELQINCENAASQPKIVIPVTSAWEMGQTAIIGAEGGDLSYGSLTVSIPARSLSQPTSLSIYRLPGAGGTADSFAVDGIPRTGRGPVTLKFHGQTAVADRPLIEISDMLAFGLGPHAVAPTADGADLTVTLPAPEPVDLAPAGAPAVRAALRHWSFGEDPTLIKIKPPFVPGYEPVLGACGPQHDSTSLIFEIHYPIDGSVLREWVQTLGDALKKACLLLQDQNVGGLVWKDRTWPISVNITGLAAKYRDVWGLEGGIFWGKSTQNIDVNILHFKSADDLTYQVPTVAHELFHVLQNLYCTYSGPYMATEDNPFWLWYMEAASTWFERRVASDTWIPTTVKPDTKLGLQQSNNYQYIGVGLGRTMGPDDRVLDRESVQNRGYGWSMFLEYLGQSGKPADIGAQFMSNGKGGFNDIVGPQQSLRNFYGPDLGNKWRDYVDKFATGRIYTSAAKGFRNFPDADSIAGMSQRFNVAARVGVDEKEFQGSIAPLAAKFYRVNFTGMQAAAGARYRFTLKGPDTLRVSVYSQDRQADGTTQLSLQASDVNPYLTDLATTLAANRTTLVVVVINPADGGDEATFSLKVEPVKQFANLTNLDFILDSGCKADTPTTIDCSINTGGSVTWSGNDFKSSYSGGGVVFSVEGSLNADRTKILGLKFIYQADYTLSIAGGQQWTWNASGAATNYPNYPSNLHPAWSLSTTSCKFETGPDSLGDLNETVDVTDWSGTSHYVKNSSQQPLSLTITFH